MRKIYMDHAATTPVDPAVLEAMLPYFKEKFGNASSLHSFGREADSAIEDARIAAASVINAKPDEIAFTSGGSESDNWVIKTVPKKGDHIITSAFEHHAVLHACMEMEKSGVSVTYLPVSRDGFVSADAIEKAIRKNTRLVSIMHANNEIGTIQPVKEIGKVCRKRGIMFHTDAVQTFGKIPIDVGRMGIDFLSASAHKLYGPKGVGCLYIRNGVEIEGQISGGSQEGGRRAGTENVAGIVGFGKACVLASSGMEKEGSRLLGLRDILIDGALGIEDSWLNGSRRNRLANNANLGFDYIEGESMVLHLDMKGVSASTGSACSSESLEPSHVLTAIGLPAQKAHGSLRLTLGKSNNKDDVEYVMGVLPDIVENLRKISPLRVKRM